MKSVMALILPNTTKNSTIRKLKIAIASIIMTVFMLGNSITVFASDFDIQSYVAQYGQGNISSSHLHSTQTNLQWQSVTINGTTWYVDENGIAEAQAHYNSLQTQQTNRDNVTSQISGLDRKLGIQPDIDRATETFSGFVPAINFLLGVGVTIVTMGMTVFTVCDICYIVFPVIRGKCEDLKAEGKGVSKSRTQKSGETRLMFVSDEAEYAINAAETTQTGKNPIIIYGKKRAVAIIVTSVAIFILLSGNLSVITDIAIKGASGIINLIGEMGS